MLLDEAVQIIGANVTAIQADATKLEDLDRIADAVRSTKGKVGVVVSNAALVEQVPLPEITPDHYDRTFALNARAPLFLVQKMLPMMGRGGSMILVSSAMHYMGLANHSTHAATKAAMRCGRIPGLGRPSSRTAASERTRRARASSTRRCSTPRRPRPRRPPRFVRATSNTLLC
jgi:hypothetical protein